MSNNQFNIAEQWRPVVEYEGYYSVSSSGKVRREFSITCTKKGCILRPYLTHGYHRISLCKEGKIKRYFIHQLVAAAFIGKCPKKLIINHIDCNKLNNHHSNLEYVTHQQNSQHASKMGRLATGEDNWMVKNARIFFSGDNNPAKKHPECMKHGSGVAGSKLTESQVIEIRKSYTGKHGEQIRLANKYGVGKVTIGVILKRKTWRHV